MRILLACLLLSFTVNAQQRPNIIYIMSDDHDADAISAYSKKFISTPNIDRLAKEGMKVCVLEQNRQFGGNLQIFSRDRLFLIQECTIWGAWAKEKISTVFFATSA